MRVLSLPPTAPIVAVSHAECGQARDRILAHETALAERLRTADAQQHALTQVHNGQRSADRKHLMISVHGST